MHFSLSDPCYSARGKLGARSSANGPQNLSLSIRPRELAAGDVRVPVIIARGRNLRGGFVYREKKVRGNWSLSAKKLYLCPVEEKAVHKGSEKKLL